MDYGLDINNAFVSILLFSLEPLIAQTKLVYRCMALIPRAIPFSPPRAVSK